MAKWPPCSRQRTIICRKNTQFCKFQYIKKDPRFLPVRIDTSMARTKQKMWVNRNCYTTKYIRLDEIKHIFNQRTGRKLVVEYY